MKKINILILLIFVTSLTACKKCNQKGEVLLTEEFDAYGDWQLYSEYSSTDEFYSRIENGVLKLKTDNQFTHCQRATLNWAEDLSAIKGFQACIHFNELVLPKDVDVHFYFSLGTYELHTTIEKRKTTNTILVLKVDNKGVRLNLKGALNGHLGAEIEGDDYSANFIQISLCPEEESEGEMYIEIDKIEITTL